MNNSTNASYPSLDLLQGRQANRIPLLMSNENLSPSDARFHNASTIIIKITHRCNLDCAYCYEYITKGSDMSLDTFRNLTDKVLTSSKHQKIRFIFHGGEPTLLSNDWFYSSVKYANYIARKNNKEVIFSVQTNLIALSKEKIKVFEELGISIGASIDGYSNIPEPQRKRAEIAIENYKLMQSQGVKAGILTTINHSNFNKFFEICSWLEKELSVRKFKANVASSVGRGKNLPELHPEQIFWAYHDILEHMINTGGQGLIEENIALELIRYFSLPEEIHELPVEICRTKNCGAGKTVIGITSEGNLLPCGRFEWNDQDYVLGNLIGISEVFDKAAYDKAVESFHASVPQNWYNCEKCEAKKVCSFGCQAFIVRSKLQANIDCIPTKMRFLYYQENYTRIEPIMEKLRLRMLSAKKHPIPQNGYPDNSYNDSVYSDYSDSIDDD